MRPDSEMARELGGRLAQIPVRDGRAPAAAPAALTLGEAYKVQEVRARSSYVGQSGQRGGVGAWAGIDGTRGDRKHQQRRLAAGCISSGDESLYGFYRAKTVFLEACARGGGVLRFESPPRDGP